MTSEKPKEEKVESSEITSEQKEALSETEQKEDSSDKEQNEEKGEKTSEEKEE